MFSFSFSRSACTVFITTCSSLSPCSMPVRRRGPASRPSSGVDAEEESEWASSPLSVGDLLVDGHGYQMVIERISAPYVYVTYGAAWPNPQDRVIRLDARGRYWKKVRPPADLLLPGGSINTVLLNHLNVTLYYFLERRSGTLRFELERCVYLLDTLRGAQSLLSEVPPLSLPVSFIPESVKERIVYIYGLLSNFFQHRRTLMSMPSSASAPPSDELETDAVSLADRLDTTRLLQGMPTHSLSTFLQTVSVSGSVSAWREGWQVTYSVAGGSEGPVSYRTWLEADDVPDASLQTDRFSLLIRTGLFQGPELVTLSSYVGSRLHQNLFMYYIDPVPSASVLPSGRAAVRRLPAPLSPPAGRVVSVKSSVLPLGAFQPFFPLDALGRAVVPPVEFSYLTDPILEGSGTAERLHSFFSDHFSFWTVVACELPILFPYGAYRGKLEYRLLETRLDAVAMYRRGSQWRLAIVDYKTMVGRSAYSRKVLKRVDCIQIVINALLFEGCFHCPVDDLMLAYVSTGGDVSVCEVPFRREDAWVKSMRECLFRGPEGSFLTDRTYCFPSSVPRSVVPLFATSVLGKASAPPVGAGASVWAPVGTRATPTLYTSSVGVLTEWAFPPHSVWLWGRWEGESGSGGVEGDVWRVPPPGPARHYPLNEPPAHRLFRQRINEQCLELSERLLYEDGALLSGWDSSSLDRLLGVRLEEGASARPLRTRHQEARGRLVYFVRAYQRALNRWILREAPACVLPSGSSREAFPHQSQRAYWTLSALSAAATRGLSEIDRKLRSLLQKGPTRDAALSS